MSDPIEYLNALASRIAQNDPELAAELARRAGGGDEKFSHGVGTGPIDGVLPHMDQWKSIIFPCARPAVPVLNHGMVIRLGDADAEVWRERLEDAAGVLDTAVRAVGRVELVGHFGLHYAGTAFLVDDDVVVTNAHVAREFAIRMGPDLRFRHNEANQPVGARIDFMEESGNSESETFRVSRILHLAADVDIALLQVERNEHEPGPDEPVGLPARALLAADDPAPGQDVVTIGYPGWDSSVRDRDVMERLFSGRYEKKCISPGAIVSVAEDRLLTHDCSTLSGNSGSPIVDLASGRVVGLHVEGQYNVGNSALPASRIVQALRAIGRG